jgi:tetratricopeptide (TPR) repeat protein
MREQDKIIARWALQRKRLSIEQVEQIRIESDRSGRTFKDIAVGRGLLSADDFKPPPARKIPPVYFVLLACTLVIFGGLLFATLYRMQERTRKDEDLALESERSNVDADRKGAEASRGYKRSLVTAKESAAREQLAKARAAMARVDQILQRGGFPNEIGLRLDEAFVAYNMYLQETPGDAAVLIERARTHELRRNYDLAIADLDRASRLKPELEPALKERIAQLRLLLPRKPQ